MLDERITPPGDPPRAPAAVADLPEPARRRSPLAIAARVLVSIALMGLLVGGALAFQRYMTATRTVTPRLPPPERVRLVDVLVAEPATVSPMLRLFGQISAGRAVDLRMLVGGEIVRTAPGLVEGGRVARDEALVAVDAFEYEGALTRARSELGEAEARLAEIAARVQLEREAQLRAREQLEVSEREVERLAMLQSRGATTDAALDQSRSRLAAARLAVETRDAQVRILDAQAARERAALERLRWNVQKSERDIRNTTLLAPFEAIVSNVAAEAGRLVNVNDRVATLVDLDRFEVRFSVSDTQYGRLVGDGGGLEGRKVRVVWRGGAAEREASGSVDRVSPVVAAATGGFDVLARITRSPATEALRPGAFVNVEMPDATFVDVVRVPQSAVHPGSRVFAIGDDGRLAAIEVTIAGYDGDAPLVRGPIRPGQRLMVTRLPDAAPGVLVKGR